MNYQKLIIVGNITADAKRETSQSGDIGYTTFRVAVSHAQEQPIFFPVVVFGKRGEALAEYLTKGRQVAVEGRISVSEQGRFNVVAREVELGIRTEKKPEKATVSSE